MTYLLVICHLTDCVLVDATGVPFCSAGLKRKRFLANSQVRSSSLGKPLDDVTVQVSTRPCALTWKLIAVRPCSSARSDDGG